MRSILELPRVLDEIHRTTIIRTLASMRIATGGGSWEELPPAIDIAEIRMANGKEPQYVFPVVEYRGGHPVGPIFKDTWRLVRSGTLYMRSSTEDDAVETIHPPTRYIGLHAARRKPDPWFTRILLIPDSPPVAVHGQDEFLLIKQKRMPSDAQIIPAITEGFGPEAIETITEAAAATLIYALQNSETRIAEG